MTRMSQGRPLCPLVPADPLRYRAETMKSLVLAAFALCLCAACGDDRVPGMAGNDSTLVGGPCSENDDCDQKLCETIPTFPGGLCTLSCGNDNDCPRGSSCAGLTSGWVCLVDCQTSSDCRVDWSCSSVPLPGNDVSGTVMACIGPEVP